jgi:hypothetical protein
MNMLQRKDIDERLAKIIEDFKLKKAFTVNEFEENFFILSHEGKSSFQILERISDDLDTDYIDIIPEISRDRDNPYVRIMYYIKL